MNYKASPLCPFLLKANDDYKMLSFKSSCCTSPMYHLLWYLLQVSILTVAYLQYSSTQRMYSLQLYFPWELFTMALYSQWFSLLSYLHFSLMFLIFLIQLLTMDLRSIFPSYTPSKQFRIKQPASKHWDVFQPTQCVFILVHRWTDRFVQTDHAFQPFLYEGFPVLQIQLLPRVSSVQ